MRKAIAISACFALAACSHIPFIPKKPVVVGIVEFDTGLTRFSTVTGIYHQDMCSKHEPDARVHLSDPEMKAILKTAGKTGFYKAKADLTTDWPDPASKPLHCATFRLRVESGATRNEVRWDCGSDGSNAAPADIAPLVELVRETLQSKAEVRAMPWSSCSVR